MMPSTAFGDLLVESPYVKKDLSAQASAKQDLQLALASLEALKAKMGAETKDDPAATMLAYQVMYQCAKALIHQAGYRITNFRVLLSALETLYVKTNRLDGALLKSLAASQEVVAGTAQHAAAAEQWISKAKELIS